MDAQRILVADDHPLAREGLIMAVRQAMPGLAICTAGTIAEAEALAEMRGGFRLALLDLVLPDTRGLSGLLRLQFTFPTVPIVIITANEDVALAAAARDLGAVGYLYKSAPLDALTDALRAIARGERLFPQGTGASDAAPWRDRLALLSAAQRRVLFALADGRANKQIAHDLAITEATVKAHLTAIFRQFGVTNRMQAMLVLQPLLASHHEH